MAFVSCYAAANYVGNMRRRASIVLIVETSVFACSGCMQLFGARAKYSIFLIRFQRNISSILVILSPITTLFPSNKKHLKEFLVLGMFSFKVRNFLLTPNKKTLT